MIARVRPCCSSRARRSRLSMNHFASTAPDLMSPSITSPLMRSSAMISGLICSLAMSRFLSCRSVPKLIELQCLAGADPHRAPFVVGEIVSGLWMEEDRQLAVVEHKPRNDLREQVRVESDLKHGGRMRPDRL